MLLRKYRAGMDYSGCIYIERIKAVALSKVLTAMLLKWLNDNLVKVEQWPLTSEKLKALEELVQEQLNA